MKWQDENGSRVAKERLAAEIWWTALITIDSRPSARAHTVDGRASFVYEAAALPEELA